MNNEKAQEKAFAAYPHIMTRLHNGQEVDLNEWKRKIYAEAYAEAYADCQNTK